jgi:peptidoglycan/xylan/chitin deacetylase (PgdA/CDA1 family)
LIIKRVFGGALSKFVISLDFELFWGVADSKTINAYGKNVAGVWNAVPAMLALFRRYGIRVTWATVGMLMCRDYSQWRDILPVLAPSYERKSCSTYLLGELASEHPSLFFARPLVEQIASTPGQELASHTFSHFYTEEPGTTAEQFAADLAASQAIAAEVGVRQTSIVFPRNQIRPEYKNQLRAAGFSVYRANPAHTLYKSGHRTPLGAIGRVVRLTDSWLPLTGGHVGQPRGEEGLVAVPASLFVRPWSAKGRHFEALKQARLKSAMTAAAKSGGICHLWWHPHNFGTNLEMNLVLLDSLLKHFVQLRDTYGMASASMADFAGVQA